MRVSFQGIWASACLGALSLSLMAQQPPPAKGHYTVSGTVVNSVTGDPIPRALVTANAETTQTMLTGGDGQFEFHNLNTARPFISARKPGFFSEQEINPDQFNGQALAQVNPSEPVVVKLIPEGVITGRIESEAGPVEGVAREGDCLARTQRPRAI